MKPAREYRHDFNRSTLQQWQHDQDIDALHNLARWAVLVSTAIFAIIGVLCLI